jgi:hypothetical protein
MRTLVGLLLLANLGFLALASGWLQPYVGLSTQHEREPQRLATQVHPESVRVRAVGVAAANGATSAASCLQAGPFSLEQIETLEAELSPAMPTPATWQRQPAEPAGDARMAMFWLRVEQPDAALRQQLQQWLAATPGASLGACAEAR